MRIGRGLTIVLLVSALSALCYCAAQTPAPFYLKDGKEYGKVGGAFRHRWWNYYERGLSYADGGFYDEALSDFREAISQRDEDQRRARTYGMHFIDYFPHRELGVVFYRLGDLPEAERELELSLSQFPSAKARFYLDRVRKALIEQKAPEVTAPRLILDLTGDEVWTREDPVVLSGTAEDEQYVAGVKIGAVPIFMEGSEKRVSFRESLALSQGRHFIEIEAWNLLGKATRRQLVIRVDREGPLITLDQLSLDETTAGREIVVSGFLYDEATISDLMVNELEIPIQKGIEVNFTKRLAVGTDQLDLVARDRLGNQTSARISLSDLRSALRKPHSVFHNPVRLACADPVTCGALMAALFGSRDTRAPGIQLKGWTDSQTVYLPKVYIEGQVGDESGIESLTINSVPILRRKGQSIFFSHVAELREGENSIIIEARDEAGNLSNKTISITRRIPKALQLTERLSVSVNPFEQRGAVSGASLSFQDNLIDALVEQNRFRVVERDKLDLILREQKLSRSNLIDRRTALKLGRLVAAQSIIAGSIIETRSGIEIVARMIDTETSEILATVDVYDEVKDLQAMISLTEGMAIKFHREFPLLGGLVIRRRGKQIFTDLGQDKVKLQRKLIVYREKPLKHPATGKVLGADNEIIGRARINQVMPEMSRAEFLDDEVTTVDLLDKVITE
jgi:tetratricopeptide (TPR) repeat protein/TolB-like protein